MSPKIDAFVDRHWKGILGILVGGIIAWQTLEAKVRGLDERKADKSEVQDIRNDIRSILKEQEGTNRMLCRNPQNRSDSACP